MSSSSSSSLLTEEWWTDFVAGWVSGAVGVVACQPLDTVLTRFQAAGATKPPALVAASAAFRATGNANSNGNGAVGVTVSAVHRNARGLVQEFGLRSLWRGSSPMIGAVPIQNALLMGGYGFGKRYSETTGNDDTGNNDSDTDNANANSTTNSLLPVFVGGCAGGVLQSFLMSPVEWIKVHQQTATSTTMARSAVRKIFFSAHNNQQQRHGLWNRGLAATLLRDGIPHGVWFASYECCKTAMMTTTTTKGMASATNDDGDPSSSSSSFYKTVTVPVVSGAFAATTAWTVGYPFDIIKTRIQATATTEAAPGVWETGLRLVQEANGNVAKGLYRGFGLKLVRSVPASMIGFFTYEFVSDRLVTSN